MPNLIESHLIHDRTRSHIFHWKNPQMPIQVRLYLALCFSKEPQIPLIPKGPSCHAKRKRTKIPGKIQQTGTPAKLSNTPLCPGQMFNFLIRSNAQGTTHLPVTRGEGLALIKSLGTNLATMINPHQPNDVPTLNSI